MYIRLQQKLVRYKLRRPVCLYTMMAVILIFSVSLLTFGWYCYFNYDAYTSDVIVDYGPKVVSARGIITYYPELTETYRDFEMNFTDVSDQILPVVTRIKEKDCKAVFKEWLQLGVKQSKRARKDGLLRRHAEFTLNGYSFLLEENQVIDKDKFPEASATPKYSVKDLMEKDVELYINSKEKYLNGLMAMQNAMNYNGLRWQRGLVFGGKSPYTESIAMMNHASHVTSVGWAKNVDNAAEKTSVSFLRPDDLASQIQRSDEQIGYYDFIAAFDTINNLGIGLFEGDPVDPTGDIKEMQKLRCLLKNSGLFYLGVPIGADCLYWNQYRIYGQIRLPLVFSGFTIVDVFNATSEHPIPLQRDTFQPERIPCKHDNFVVFTLRKTLNSKL